MTKIITFGIQKGGSSKTTTSGVVSYLLSREHKVLAIDLDSQGNLTEFLTQRDIYDYHNQTVFEALQERNAKKYIHPTPLGENLHILTAEDHLARFPSWLYTKFTGNRSLVLAETIDGIIDDYDYIIIDTPPALSDITINALCASDHVVAMFESSKFCYSALGRFLETCIHVQDKINSNLKITGILRCMIDTRRTDNKAFVKIVEEEYGDTCFETIITRTAATGRLSLNGFLDNPELSIAVSQYEKFVKELQGRV